MKKRQYIQSKKKKVLLVSRGAFLDQFHIPIIKSKNPKNAKITRHELSRLQEQAFICARMAVDDIGLRLFVSPNFDKLDVACLEMLNKITGTKFKIIENIHA